MLITKDKLEELSACEEAIKFFEEHYTEIEEAVLLKDVLKYVEEVKEKYDADVYGWSYWLIAHTVSKEDAVRFAIYSAEQVLHIFEEKYPEDMRPRRAIEAAKAYLENPNKDTRKAAWEAAEAARAAAYAIWAAWEAAEAARAAAEAAEAARAAAAYAAVRAADADPNLKDRILEFGISLLEG